MGGMMKKRKSGFTIVELLVVIVVIAILASITLVAYNSIQKRALDTKIRTTVDDVGKALLVKYLDGENPASGYWSNTNGVDDLLVPGSLPAGYRDGQTSPNAGNYDNHTFRYYRCGETFALYASLNKPTDDDISHLAAVKAQCGLSDDYVPIEGAEPTYNYGKIFK